MNKINKSAIAPIIAVLAIAVQLVFGVEIPEPLQTEITTAVVNITAVGVAVYGIFKNHK